MNRIERRLPVAAGIAALLAATAFPAWAQPAPAAEKKAQTAAPKTEPKMPPDSAAMMEAAMKAAAPGENHKLLARSAGNWTYAGKFWMDPSAPPMESKGTSTFTSVLGGRYVRHEHKGQFAGGEFHGIGMDGYDNLKKKFVTAWIDNMGTSITMMEGAYDQAKKTFTYTGEMMDPMKAGATVKIRQTIRLVSDDHHVLEWYEGREGKEVKTMELTYMRQKGTS